MRYRLRTLMIVLALGPPIAGGMWWALQPQRSPWHGMRGSARTQATLLADAVKLYALDLGELPKDLDALISPPPNLATPQKWMGPYVEKVELPIDPWDNSYHYQIKDKAKGFFQVWSSGPDGRTPSKDDIIASH